MSEHWHILGAGAIGCLFGDTMHRAGIGVTMLLRPGSPLPRQGRLALTVEADGRCRSAMLPAAYADRAPPISHLLVTTKAYDVASAVETIAASLQPGAVVVILANGMGFAEPLKTRHPAARFYRATTTEAALRRGHGYIRHTGSGRTLVGASDAAPAPAWFARWRRLDLHCAWCDDIQRVLWQKLTVNCVINPLTALHRCRNGSLWEDATLYWQVEALCKELAAVGAAAGHPEPDAQVLERVTAVIKATAANRSSMLQDIESGAPTEVDFITGYLLRVAAREGIDVPLHRALHHRLGGS